jgi:hypothetical protein
MQEYDLQDLIIGVTVLVGSTIIVVLIMALIFSALNPPQCPEGLIYIPRLNICMEG